MILNKNVFCGLTGRIVTWDDPFYQELRQGWNRAIQKFPLAIVYCRNKCDVCNAVMWARRFSVPLRIRSGGHNYEGYSNGDCALVIDLSEMNCLELDEYANLLYVQGGVTNRRLYKFVSAKGYPFPGGTCPTVGVSGYALGGGWGLSCRYLGLGCDSLVEIEVVNYKGAIIKASRRRNADLFWACRGAGGGNFGVIVSMTFRLPPRIDKVTLIEIDYLHVSPDEQKLFLQMWQKWLKGADKRMTLISRIYNSPNDGLSMLVRGIFYGTPEEAEQIIRCFLELGGANSNLEYLTFLQAVTIIGSTYPSSEMFKSASRFVLRDFSPEESGQMVGLVKDRPQGSVFAALSMYALGGRVAEVDRDDTAFFYRNSNYIVWLETVWEDRQYAKINTDWVNNQFPYLKSVTTGSYINFPYAELAHYMEEYYGNHAYILKKIKNKYDPLNVFTFPQSIGKEGYCCLPASASASKDNNAKNHKQQVPVHPASDVNCRGFRYVQNRCRT